jgi:protein TonB
MPPDRKVPAVVSWARMIYPTDLIQRWHLNEAGVKRLAAWIAFSVLAHVLVFSVVGGVALIPVNAPFHQTLNANIQHIAPEIAGPLTVPDTESEIRAEPADPPLPQPEKTQQKIPDPVTAPEAVIDLPLPLDAYFSTDNVDTRAQPTNDVLLFYPLNAYKRKISGTVRMTLLINERGSLDKVIVVDATPPGIFEEAALEAVGKLQFTPALRGGRQVKSRKTIDVVFDPSEHLQPASR